MTSLPLIDLLKGWPTPRLFPTEDLLLATQATLVDRSTASSALIYGPSLGYLPLRESVAEWLSTFYSPTSGLISRERIGISGGASANLASILQIFSDPARTTIWMVEPVYFHACTIFQDAGFAGKLRGVPESENGIDINFFRRALEVFEDEEKKDERRTVFKPEEQYQKIYKHILYTTPTFSNPSGKTMSHKEREELVELARKFDVLIIADDVYDFLRWPVDDYTDRQIVKPPARIVDIDRETCALGSWGHSVSNASFSKIVAPGARVGWYEATEKFVARLSANGSTSSGGNPAHLSSTFIHHLLSTKAIHKHINNILIPTYRARSRAMFHAIERYLVPLGIKVIHNSPASSTTSAPIPFHGGFFTYIQFPSTLPLASEVASRSLEINLKIGSGSIFLVKGDKESLARSLEPDGYSRGARLCWAWEEEDAIVEGVRRLGRVVRSFLNDEQASLYMIESLQ